MQLLIVRQCIDFFQTFIDIWWFIKKKIHGNAMLNYLTKVEFFSVVKKAIRWYK